MKYHHWRFICISKKSSLKCLTFVVCTFIMKR
uniref:Uncharacterized protein n=1 Tax=Anguilla anguilla TaxID=7936 RepID=A0A0E9U0G1_ANGAN